MRQFLIAFLLMAVLAFGLVTIQPAKADRKLDVWTLIHAGDTDAVRAALADPDLAKQRAAFAAFGTSDPVVAAFSEAFLAQTPDDPHAMTARGWYLLSAGWTVRGGGYARAVFPEAAERMRALHLEAAGLSNAALAADPLLIPASDLRIAVSMPAGQTDVVSDEIQRVMEFAPNHHSLMMAALALSPKWGGSEDYGFRMCALWADMITDIEDYSVEICNLDVVFRAGYGGETLLDAQQKVVSLSHPVFDRPRLNIAGNGVLPSEEAIAIFEELSDSEAFLLRDAARWDMEEGNGGYDGPPGLPGPQTLSALPRLLDKLRAEADFNPGDEIALWQYADALIWQRIADGSAFPSAEMEDRINALFALAPYDPESYVRISYLRDLFVDIATITLKDVSDLRTGFENAAFFSNNSPEYIRQLFLFNLNKWEDLERRNIDALDVTGEPAFDRNEFDAEIICPTIRSILVLEELCVGSKNANSCPEFPRMVGGDPRPKLIERAKARKACAELFESDPDDLLYTQVPFEIPE